MEKFTHITPSKKTAIVRISEHTTTFNDKVPVAVYCAKIAGYPMVGHPDKSIVYHTILDLILEKERARLA